MAYKVETVGKVYMAVSGAPDENPLHMQTIADLALQMLARINDLNIEGVSVKIGFHSGPVVAGKHFLISTNIKFNLYFQKRYCRTKGTSLLPIW
jgi:hypothetical protein